MSAFYTFTTSMTDYQLAIRPRRFSCERQRLLAGSPISFSRSLNAQQTRCKFFLVCRDAVWMVPLANCVFYACLTHQAPCYLLQTSMEHPTNAHHWGTFLSLIETDRWKGYALSTCNDGKMSNCFLVSSSRVDGSGFRWKLAASSSNWTVDF